MSTQPRMAGSGGPIRPKDDVSEVRAQLKDRVLETDPMKKRRVLQRVMALMTMGYDTSSLFPEMMLACYTPDLVSKKLIYFFLTTHSERNAELAILSINTFLKECNEESPLVRGLALRSLCGMKGVPQLYEYLLPALKRGLTDRAAYVRKIAVLCTLSIFRATPTEFISHGFYDSVLGMLRDTDPQVCANALEVLLEIADYDKKWEEAKERELELDGEEDADFFEGSAVASSEARGASRRARGVTEEEYAPSQHTPFLITKSVLYHLLNHLNGLNEWQQTQIINLIHQYTPTTEEEMFDIMNVLEERLTGMHSGLILSCSHAFIYLTQNHPAVHAQVLERLRQPLLMLLTCSPSVEAAYAVLCHIKLLVKRAPQVYQHSYKAFYCRHNEPSYVKALKIEILSIIADGHSAPAIVQELVATSEDRNLILARRAIEALGTVALRLSEMAKPIMNRFIDFISLGIVRIRGATLVVMIRLLRKYREGAILRPFIAAVLDAHRATPFHDDDSRVALAWVLGELGEHIDTAPYVLDTLCDNLLQESAAFRLQVLTSAVTLFFKRPPEMQQLLGRIFDVLANDFSNADVLDRAMMYYRLLKDDPTFAAHVICVPKRPVTTFVEDQDSDMIDNLFFEEFDSLSVVYGLPAEKFALTRAVIDDDGESEDEDEDAEPENEGEPDAGYGYMQGDVTATYHDGAPSSGPSPEAPFAPPSPNQQHLGLLEGSTQDTVADGGNMLAKIFGGTARYSAASPSATPVPYAAPAVTASASSTPTPSIPTVAAAPLSLSDNAEMEAQQFQAAWAELPVQSALTVSVNRMSDTEALEEYLEEHRVFTLASGGQAGSLKLYLYAQSAGAAAGPSPRSVDALFGDAPVAGAAALFLVEVVIDGNGAARVTVKSRSAQGKAFATHLQSLLQQFSL